MKVLLDVERERVDHMGRGLLVADRLREGPRLRLFVVGQGAEDARHASDHWHSGSEIQQLRGERGPRAQLDGPAVSLLRKPGHHRRLQEVGSDSL